VIRELLDQAILHSPQPPARPKTSYMLTQ
jgi:hypothetical protein